MQTKSTAGSSSTAHGGGNHLVGPNQLEGDARSANMGSKTTRTGLEVESTAGNWTIKPYRTQDVNFLKYQNADQEESARHVPTK